MIIKVNSLSLNVRLKAQRPTRKLTQNTCNTNYTSEHTTQQSSQKLDLCLELKHV